MKLYSCWCRHKGGQTMQLPLPKVTAAEVFVLRAIHGDDAVVKIKYIGDRNVDDAVEFARLMKKYEMAQLNGQSIVEQCFPGINPILPQEVTKPVRTAKTRMVEDDQIKRPDELEADDVMLKKPVDITRDEDADADDLPPAEGVEDEEENDVMLDDDAPDPEPRIKDGQTGRGVPLQ